MNEIITRLTQWGCDTQSAIELVCDDEEFYVECLHDITQDPCFELLKTKLDAGDISGAFDVAHSLKGVFANVGLTPMYNKIVELVEPLRAGSTQDLSMQYKQLIEMKTYLEDILAVK